LPGGDASEAPASGTQGREDRHQPAINRAWSVVRCSLSVDNDGIVVATDYGPRTTDDLHERPAPPRRPSPATGRPQGARPVQTRAPAARAARLGDPRGRARGH